MVSWIFLAYSIKKRDFLSLILLGVFSGFTAFTHLIGAAVAILNCVTFIIFLILPVLAEP